MGFTGNVLPLFLDQYVFCVETTLRENLFLELIFSVLLNDFDTDYISQQAHCIFFHCQR